MTTKLSGAHCLLSASTILPKNWARAWPALKILSSKRALSANASASASNFPERIRVISLEIFVKGTLLLIIKKWSYLQERIDLALKCSLFKSKCPKNRSIQNIQCQFFCSFSNEMNSLDQIKMCPMNRHQYSHHYKT